MPVGSFYSWSVFIDPIRRARPNFSSSSSVHTNALVIAALSVSCAATGKLLGYDRFGVRSISAIGAIISVIGLTMCGTSIACDVEALLFLGGLFNGFGMGMCYVSFIKNFKTSFHDFPGFAAGWVMFASSGGSFVFVWICHELLDRFDRKFADSAVLAPAATFFVLAAILFVMQFFGSFLLIDTKAVEKEKENQDTNVDQNDFLEDKIDSLDDPLVNDRHHLEITLLSTTDLLSSIPFWLVLFVFFANLFPVLGVLSIFASYVQSRFQSSSTAAANALAIINVVGTLFRLVVGALSEHVGRFRLFGCSLLVQTALLALLYRTIDDSGMNLVRFTAIISVCKMAYGSGFTLVNLLIDDVFGKADGTQVYGFVIFGLMAASLTSPNIVVVWYHHHEDNEDRDGAVDDGDIKFYFLVSFVVTAIGSLALLALRCKKTEAKNGGAQRTY